MTEPPLRDEHDMKHVIKTHSGQGGRRRWDPGILSAGCGRGRRHELNRGLGASRWRGLGMMHRRRPSWHRRGLGLGLTWRGYGLELTWGECGLGLSWRKHRLGLGMVSQRLSGSVGLRAGYRFGAGAGCWRVPGQGLGAAG